MVPRTERSCSFKPLDEEGQEAEAKPWTRPTPRLVLLPPRSAAASSGSSAQKPVHVTLDGKGAVVIDALIRGDTVREVVAWNTAGIAPAVVAAIAQRVVLKGQCTRVIATLWL